MPPNHQICGMLASVNAEEGAVTDTDTGNARDVNEVPRWTDIPVTDLSPVVMDAIRARMIPPPSHGYWPGWQAHPDTLTDLRETAEAACPETMSCLLLSLVGVPIELCADVPTGFLRPVHVRLKETSC
jgi:hypothetical protein